MSSKASAKVLNVESFENERFPIVLNEVPLPEGEPGGDKATTLTGRRRNFLSVNLLHFMKLQYTPDYLKLSCDELFADGFLLGPIGANAVNLGGILAMGAFLKVAIAATFFLATPAIAAPEVIEGPSEFENNESGWSYSGVEFVANQDASLDSFTFNSQGLADTIYLTDENGIILYQLAVTSGELVETYLVSWLLQSGQTYQLLRSTASNSQYNSYGAEGFGLPSNSNISMTNTGVFTQDITAGTYFTDLNPDYFWSTFTNITTTSMAGAVPEPSTWLMLLFGFFAAGAGLRRRKLPNTSLSFG